MLFLVATNVIASRPPKRRLTGTLHALAKIHQTQIGDQDQDRENVGQMSHFDQMFKVGTGTQIMKNSWNGLLAFKGWYRDKL